MWGTVDSDESFKLKETYSKKTVNTYEEDTSWDKDSNSYEFKLEESKTETISNKIAPLHVHVSPAK